MDISAYLLSGPAVIKPSTLNSNKLEIFMFINVKMPTIVDILTFISKIKTTSDRLKARTTFIFHHFTFYEQLKFHTQLRLSMKKVF